MLAVYSLGLAVPFLLTSLGIERFLKFYSRFRSHMHALEVGSGALLIVLGGLLVFGPLYRDRALFLVFESLCALVRSESVKRNLAALFFVAVLVAAMLYVASHGIRGAGGNNDEPRRRRQTRARLHARVARGQKHPAQRLQGTGRAAEFLGDLVRPCKIEMPWFVELQKEYGPQGLQIVGVAMDDASKEDIAKFVKEMGVNYPILLGKEAVGKSTAALTCLPTTFFIDRDGKIVAREFGLQSRSLFVDNIKKSLSQGRRYRRKSNVGADRHRSDILASC